MGKNRLETQYKYHKNNIKRVPLDMQKEYFETVLKPCADDVGETVNGFIKKAIQDRIDSIQGK